MHLKLRSVSQMTENLKKLFSFDWAYCIRQVRVILTARSSRTSALRYTRRTQLRKLSLPFGWNHSQCTAPFRELHLHSKNRNYPFSHIYASYVGDLEKTQTITVKVYDRDIVGSDYCGQCIVSLEKLISARTAFLILEDFRSSVWNSSISN